MSIIHKGNKIASNAVTGDTLPIGAIVELDDTIVPDGWEQVPEDLIGNAITICPTSTGTIGATNIVTQLPLNKVHCSNGTSLSNTSNGVKIGAGVSKVEASGVIEVQSANITYFNGYLRIGTAGKCFASQGTGGVGQTQRIIFPPILLDVVENDNINLAYYGNTADNYFGGGATSVRTYLTVRVIE